MPSATPAAVRKQIASGSTAPIYLLSGEDDIEKIALANEFEELVEEGLRAFNVERIYAGDWTTGDRLVSGVGSLVAAARTLPMLAPRRVVILLQADPLLLPKRESEAATRALEELERLLKRPEEQTTLVIVSGSLDKRSRIYRLLARDATIVECGVLLDQADVERWIRNRIASVGLEIAPAATRRLAELCGLDIKRLRNDVERLLLYVLGRKSISVEDVHEIAGPASLQDDWAMTNAMEAGNEAEALRQLALMFDSGGVPEKILGQLGWLVRSRLPLRNDGLRRAVDAVFRTDLDLKRSAGDPRVLLERLVVELCEEKRARAR